MSKPLLLDTYCKAGGTSMGYHRAGFEVVGVDIEPQKRYPFEFHQSDAIEFIIKYGGDFDVIAASPPCQGYSVTKSLHNNEYPKLIKATREAIKSTGKPYVIENVPGARFELDNPIMLCGTMFGLRVIRHRYFECSPVIWWPPRQCTSPHPLCFTMDKRKPHYGKLDEMKNFVQVNGGGNCSKKSASDAMGIDWMTKEELNQAIPPAYTEWLGKELKKVLDKK